MRIAGSAEDFFQSVRQARRPFAAAGSLASAAAGPWALGTVVVGAAVKRRREESKLRRMIRQEAARAVKSRQGPGLNFDLFG